MESVPVLVVGGGLVGLSASLLLTHHGVRHLVVERHAGTSIQPKARRFNFRTMEVFRGIGLESAIHEAAKDLADYQAMRKGHCLVDSAQLPSWTPGELAVIEACTPCASALIAQDVLEPVLRAAAEERGGDLRFGVELLDFDQDDDGVTARLDDGSMVRADYVIAADGAHSPIRERLEIARTGRGSLGRSVNVHFRSDLSELIRGREFNLCLVDGGVFASIDGTHRWLLLTDHVELSTEQWEARIRELIGEAGGRAELPVEILSVLEWEPTMRVAERFSDGRIFLAGDAAHVMPPFAAMGANTGIQDVHNLAWKLANVLQGKASRLLLETYDTERRPVGEYTAEQSVRFGETFGAEPGGTGQPEVADPLALVVGQQYVEGAFVPDGSAQVRMDRLDLAGQPGTRVPHSWLDQAETRSTIDLADRDFALLTEANTGSEFARLAGIEGGKALLVRPDGIVAMRAPVGQVSWATRSARSRTTERAGSRRPCEATK